MARTLGRIRAQRLVSAILLCIAAGIGIAIGDANRRQTRRYYFGNPQYPTRNALAGTPIVRKDGSRTTVPLRDIATFEPRNIRVFDPRNRYERNYRFNLIRLIPPNAKANGVTELDVLDGLWDARFVPVISIDLKPVTASDRKIFVRDVIRALQQVSELSNGATRWTFAKTIIESWCDSSVCATTNIRTAMRRFIRLIPVRI